MNDTAWRVIVGVLAVALAVVGGILIAVLVGQGGPDPTTSPSAAVSPDQEVVLRGTLSWP